MQEQEQQEEKQQLPKPHRCNDRLEDFVQRNQNLLKGNMIHGPKNCEFLGNTMYMFRLTSTPLALFEDNFRKNVPATWKLFWKCYKSEPGDEPTEPFYFLKIEPPVRKENVLDSD